jgi:hypothetical protein
MYPAHFMDVFRSFNSLNQNVRLVHFQAKFLMNRSETSVNIVMEKQSVRKT